MPSHDFQQECQEKLGVVELRNDAAPDIPLTCRENT